MFMRVVRGERSFSIGWLDIEASLDRCGRSLLTYAALNCALAAIYSAVLRAVCVQLHLRENHVGWRKPHRVDRGPRRFLLVWSTSVGRYLCGARSSWCWT